jgi:nuclear pore complex protein Nup205
VTLIEEAVILSDLYNMNELLAVELLLEAETQMQYFPNLTRGLTAILLYYDSKKSIVNTLKLLLMARSGRTWILDDTMPAELTKLINDYTNRLIYDGLILNLLSKNRSFSNLF